MKLPIIDNLVNIKIWFTALFLQVAPLPFIQKYLFADFNYLKWLAIVMVLDLITGIAKVYKKDGLSAITSRGLRDTIVKSIQYGAFLIVTHVFTHYEINGDPISELEWVNKMAKEFILLIEIKSVYENIVAINPKFDFVSKVWGKVVDMFPVKPKKES